MIRRAAAPIAAAARAGVWLFELILARTGGQHSLLCSARRDTGSQRQEPGRRRQERQANDSVTHRPEPGHPAGIGENPVGQQTRIKIFGTSGHQRKCRHDTEQFDHQDNHNDRVDNPRHRARGVLRLLRQSGQPLEAHISAGHHHNARDQGRKR